jgi:gas vesicle protein
MSNDRTKHLLAGFLGGAVIGGILALLYAPKPGKELRGDIRRKSGELADDIGKMMGEAQDKAKILINEGREKSTALISDAKVKADQLLHDAEQMLSDAKTRVQGEGTRLKTAVKAGMDAYRDERDRGPREA